MQQKIIDLYDSYTHGGLSRRTFLDRFDANSPRLDESSS